jgi:hypothetical protein
MSSFAPAILDNLRLTHDVVAAIRAIGEGKGKQDLFKERALDLLENLRQVAIIEHRVLKPPRRHHAAAHGH